MLISKTENGGIVLTDLIKGNWFSMQYQGYTLREAKSRFKKRILEA